MSNLKQLGASWEDEALYFVESSETNPEKVFHVPFEHGLEPTQKTASNIWKEELAEKIKDVFREQKVSTAEVNLSLPTKDIIFRSFVIPWMQKNEVKNVVEFEACKYIPFSLKELSYSYHPIAIEEDNTKNIRIIFVAIKNDALENYVKVLEAASLTVGIIEPSALSLIRALSFKEIIPENQTIALIEKADVGRIIVSDKNIPQFVREFHLSTESPEQGPDSSENIVKKLTKEVRISIDYFKRQNDQLNIEKIFFLSSSDEGDLPKNLENYLDIPVTPVENSLVLGDTSEPGVGALNAYGASIIPSVKSLASFNLSKNKLDTPQALEYAEKASSHKWLLVTTLVCIPLILGSIVMSTLRMHAVKKEIATLNQKLGTFKDSNISIVKTKEELLKKRLTNLQRTRLNSNAALFLLLIPDLLPDGAWLKTLDISYYDSDGHTTSFPKKGRFTRRVSTSKNESTPPLMVTIDGYAYTAIKGEQFLLINILLGKLKDNEEFSKFFQNIELETTSTQKLGEQDVTYFKIVCKQANENIGSK